VDARGRCLVVLSQQNRASRSRYDTGGSEVAWPTSSCFSVSADDATVCARRVATAFAAAIRRFLVFAAFLPAALRLRVVLALLPVALRFRVVAAFFAAARRFRVTAAFLADDEAIYQLLSRIDQSRPV
jgi:hypothetical protein